jgi:hypothetical protein
MESAKKKAISEVASATSGIRMSVATADARKDPDFLEKSKAFLGLDSGITNLLAADTGGTHDQGNLANIAASLAAAYGEGKAGELGLNQVNGEWVAGADFSDNLRRLQGSAGFKGFLGAANEDARALAEIAGGRGMTYYEADAVRGMSGTQAQKALEKLREGEIAFGEQIRKDNPNLNNLEVITQGAMGLMQGSAKTEDLFRLLGLSGGEANPDADTLAWEKSVWNKAEQDKGFQAAMKEAQAAGKSGDKKRAAKAMINLTQHADRIKGLAAQSSGDDPTAQTLSSEGGQGKPQEMVISGTLMIGDKPAQVQGKVRSK